MAVWFFLEQCELSLVWWHLFSVCPRPGLSLCVRPATAIDSYEPSGCGISQRRHRNLTFITRKYICRLVGVVGIADDKVLLNRAKSALSSLHLDLWKNPRCIFHSSLCRQTACPALWHLLPWIYCWFCWSVYALAFSSSAQSHCCSC